MLRRSFLTGLAGIVVAAAAGLPAQAYLPDFTPTKWVELGEQTVSSRADRDVLILGADEGRYEALKFQVFGNRVAIAQVKVVFANGQSQYLDVKEHVRQGEMTPAYDLDKQHRIINRIEFLYQTENRRGDAVIKVLGRKDIGGGDTGWGDGSWRMLGRRDVNNMTDHDSIMLGYRAGKFRALRFHVTNAPVHIYDVRVTFANGEMQTLAVDENIAANSNSRMYDLSGYERVISRIDLVYKTRKAWKYDDHAQLMVYGLS
jgi:hypothetical protein